MPLLSDIIQWHCGVNPNFYEALLFNIEDMHNVKFVLLCGFIRNVIL